MAFGNQRKGYVPDGYIVNSEGNTRYTFPDLDDKFKAQTSGIDERLRQKMAAQTRKHRR
jgi:hypothetical protein